MRDFPRRDILAKGAATLAGLAAVATVQSISPTRAAEAATGSTGANAKGLKRFVIEREIPSIGKKTAQNYCDISRASDNALAQLAPKIQWEHSYVADDKTFCVYLAEDEAAIRRHGELSGFPVTKITEIDLIIDPTTANLRIPT
jgi:Protein of unknown function (DUF4242)